MTRRSVLAPALVVLVTGCAGDLGPARDGQVATDGAHADSSREDAVRADVATSDAIGIDAGSFDAMPTDARAIDASRTDVIAMDAARIDAMSMDAMRNDASTTDAARTDAATDSMRTDATTPRCSGRTGATGNHTVTLRSGGVDRTYEIHVPSTYNPTTPMPLVLGFHGFNNTPSILNGMSGLNTQADRRGFITVMPWGTRAGAPPGATTDLGWNAGACCGSPPGAGHDDVQLTRDILARVEADYCIDTRRVWATGFSNGAMLTHRLACDLADRIAAIAPVSGTIAIPASSCHPSRPIAVLTSHGTADTRVPWGGGGPGNATSVPTTIADWAMRDSCTDTPREIYRMGVAHCDQQRACAGGSEVRLCTIDGGTHGWLSSASYPTTTTILDFFFAHPLP